MLGGFRTRKEGAPFHGTPLGEVEDRRVLHEEHGLRLGLQPPHRAPAMRREDVGDRHLACGGLVDEPVMVTTQVPLLMWR